MKAATFLRKSGSRSSSLSLFFALALAQVTQYFPARFLVGGCGGHDCPCLRRWTSGIAGHRLARPRSGKSRATRSPPAVLDRNRGDIRSDAGRQPISGLPRPSTTSRRCPSCFPSRRTRRRSSSLPLSSATFVRAAPHRRRRPGADVARRDRHVLQLVLEEGPSTLAVGRGVVDFHLGEHLAREHRLGEFRAGLIELLSDYHVIYGGHAAAGFGRSPRRPPCERPNSSTAGRSTALWSLSLASPSTPSNLINSATVDAPFPVGISRRGWTAGSRFPRPLSRHDHRCQLYCRSPPE